MVDETFLAAVHRLPAVGTSIKPDCTVATAMSSRTIARVVGELRD